jgi:O-antigen/teichoic acid export membrane protein
MIDKIVFHFRTNFAENSGLFYILLGSLATALLSFVTVTANARIYDKIDFGQFSFVLTLVVSVGSVVGYGLGSLGMRAAAQAISNTSPTVYGDSAGILRVANRVSAASTIVLMIFLWGLLERIAPSPPGPELYVPLILSLYFYSMDAFLRLALLGQGSHKPYSFIPIVGYLPYMAIIILDINMKFVALGWLIMCILNYLLSMYFYKSSLKNSRGYLRNSVIERKLLPHFKEAFPVILSGAFVAPVQWLANLIIVAHSGTYANSAVYVVAMQWFLLISFVPNAVARALGPRLTREYFKFSYVGIRSQMLNMTLVGLASVAVPATFISVFQDPIADIYGRNFITDMNIFNYAIIASCASAVAAPVGYLILAAKRLWFGAMLNASWATIFLIGAFFAGRYGVSWVMIAMAIAYIFQAFVSWLFVVPKILKMTPQLDNVY